MQVCKNGSLACGEKVHLAGSYFFFADGVLLFLERAADQKKSRKNCICLEAYAVFSGLHPNASCTFVPFVARVSHTSTDCAS